MGKTKYVIQGKPKHPQEIWDDQGEFDDRIEAERILKSRIENLNRKDWRIDTREA